MMVNNVLSWWRNICITPHQLNRRAFLNEIRIKETINKSPTGEMFSGDLHLLTNLPEGQYIRAIKRLEKSGLIESFPVETSQGIEMLVRLKELK